MSLVATAVESGKKSALDFTKSAFENASLNFVLNHSIASPHHQPHPCNTKREGEGDGPRETSGPGTTDGLDSLLWAETSAA